MKVIVLGGAGLTGQCAVRDLLETTDFEVTIADFALEKATQIAKNLGNDRITAKYADVTDHAGTTKLIKDADVVINGVQYYHNVRVMKACIEAGVPYLDFGGLYHMTKEQLKLNTDFRNADLAAILGMGAQPGVSNVMIRYAADRLDLVDTVRIRDGWRDLTKGGPPFSVTWSFATIMDELSMNAVVFRNGKLMELPPLSEPESVCFADPVSRQEVYLTLHSELATVPESLKDKGLKNLDWKEGGANFIRLKLLVEMGLADNKPMKIQNTEVTPRDFVLKTLDMHGLVGFPQEVVPEDYEATRVEAIGERDGKAVTLVLEVLFPPKKEWHASCSQYNVGVPASIVAQMVARGHVKEKGVLPPEASIDPEPFFNELTKRGIRISIQEKRLFG